MKNKQVLFRKILSSVSRFGGYFLMTCFIITCSIILYSHTITRVTGFSFTREQITLAAKLTFVNVVFLSAFCTVLDSISKKITVDRPVQRIIDASKRVKKGDLSVRIDKFRRLDPDDSFNVIIDDFNTMVSELGSMETLRTDFIANVSHELKTPLAVIQNYGTMLQQPYLSEEAKTEYAKTITEAARSLSNMVTNILKLNKLENQSIYPETKSFNLSEQLCECFIGFENIWEKKNIEIETDIEDDVIINADPELLELVWNNLFSNALKFTEPGGTVSLRLKTDGEFAVVDVSDTGCGIDSETGRHIFEKFYQGDTSHAEKGNGLGLALVKRVIDIMNGEIDVISKVNKGSTFTVRLKIGKSDENKRNA